MAKSVRIKVTAKEATDFKKKKYWDEVLRRLVAERDAISRRIARLKNKIPAPDMEAILRKREDEERAKLVNAAALVSLAIKRGDF